MHLKSLQIVAVVALLSSLTLALSTIWVNNEAFRFHYPAAASWGSIWGWHDLRAAFDWEAYDGLPRVRFISNLIDHLNSKLAIIAGTPIFNVSGALAAASAIPLFIFVRERVGLSAAFCSVAIYACSPGFFSGVNFIFHAGKPLALLVTTLSILLAWRAVQIKGRWVNLLGLALVTFVGMLSDETAIMAGPIALAFTFDHLWSNCRRWLLCGVAWAGGVGLSLLFSAYLAPLLVDRTGYGPFTPLDFRTLLPSATWDRVTGIGWHITATIMSMLAPAWNIVAYRWGPAFNRENGMLDQVPAQMPLDGRDASIGVAAVLGMSGIFLLIFFVRRGIKAVGPARHSVGLACLAFFGSSAALGYILGFGQTAPIYYNNILSIPVAAALGIVASEQRWRSLLTASVCVLALSNSYLATAVWRSYDGGGASSPWQGEIERYRSHLDRIDAALHKVAPDANYGPHTAAVFYPEDTVARRTYLTVVGQAVIPRCETCLLALPEQPVQVISR